jgi:hypothetical protein
MAQRSANVLNARPVKCGGCPMKRLISFGCAVLVNASFAYAFVLSSTPAPVGSVLITDLNNGARISVASRAMP